MKIVSTSTPKGDFVIIDDSGKKLLKLTYANWFSSKANTTFRGENIEIRPKNIWQTKFDIFINGTDRGDITFNWKGQVILLIDDASYLLKTTSFWNLGFEVLNEKEERVFKIKPNLSWKKLKYDYEIQEINTSFKGDELTILLLYIGFATNLHMMQMMNS